MKKGRIKKVKIRGKNIELIDERLDIRKQIEEEIA